MSTTTSRRRPARPSSKISAVALAGAISTMIWTLVAVFAKGMGTAAVATLTGATTTIIAFGLGYLISD